MQEYSWLNPFIYAQEQSIKLVIAYMAESHHVVRTENNDGGDQSRYSTTEEVAEWIDGRYSERHA